jgi:hypothetical protein
MKREAALPKNAQVHILSSRRQNDEISAPKWSVHFPFEKIVIKEIPISYPD